MALIILDGLATIAVEESARIVLREIGDSRDGGHDTFLVTPVGMDEDLYLSLDKFVGVTDAEEFTVQVAYPREVVASTPSLERVA
jgi:hypothetical protein